MANITTHFNTSSVAGADTQLGVVANQVLPLVQTALREEVWMLSLCSKDFEPTIAKYGDTITYEKILGMPDIVDLSTDTTLTFTEFEVTNDYAQLDRYIGCMYAVKELDMLLPQNSQLHWNGFMENTVKKIIEYMEVDILGLHASMTNTVFINGPLGKSNYPAIRLSLKQSSKRRGPWFFLVSDHDFTNLISDTDLQNFGFSNQMNTLQFAALPSRLFNMVTIDHSLIPYASVSSSSPSTYNRLYHNIAFDRQAIQFFSRRLGIPKMFTSVTFMEVIDRDSGITYRIRIIPNAQRTQPRYEIVFEVLYGIKLFRDEFACDVTTLHNIS
jgi:hypothetical protein